LKNHNIIISKVSKIKSFSQKQSKGWLSDVYQTYLTVYTNQIVRLFVKKILDRIVTAGCDDGYLRFDYFRVL
jgi:hypothetical protein